MAISPLVKVLRARRRLENRLVPRRRRKKRDRRIAVNIRLLRSRLEFLVRLAILFLFVDVKAPTERAKFLARRILPNLDRDLKYGMSLCEANRSHDGDLDGDDENKSHKQTQKQNIPVIVATTLKHCQSTLFYRGGYILDTGYRSGG